MEISQERAAVLEWMLSDEVYWSPYRFAMQAYGWGEGDLKVFGGPRKWQREFMEDMERYLRGAYELHDTVGKWPDFYRHAVASGRGPGKSALVGMLSHWFMSTRIGGSVWVAANGEPQLRTKTFPEIGKWVSRGINREFFDVQSTSIQPATWFRQVIEAPESQGGLGKGTKYYYISGQLWSEENPDAFAGAHNYDGEMSIFDEASGIPDSIWTVQEGVFTEDIPDRMWMAFSNPRVPQGAFFECFHKNKELWRTTQIDSRTVEGVSHSTYNNIIAQHGIDSDEARVEIYGEFPHVGDSQFIGRVIVDEAILRPRYNDPQAPIVIGVDPARFGDDKTCIAVRKGRDLCALIRFGGMDTMSVVGRVIEQIEMWSPDLVVIDEGGLGAGIVDRLQEQRYKVRGVNFGSKADDSAWSNKRTEMWGLMRDWVKTSSMGSASDNAKAEDRDLRTDLTGPRYKINSDGSTQLEKKEDMKKRGYASPDRADAIAVTFAYPVARRRNSEPLKNRPLASKSKNMLYNHDKRGAWMG